MFPPEEAERSTGQVADMVQQHVRELKYDFWAHGLMCSRAGYLGSFVTGEIIAARSQSWDRGVRVS